MTRISAKMIIGGLAASLALGMAAAPASAQRYDGFCYHKQQNTKTKGTVIGAVAGGVLGNVVAGKGNKTEGTVLGAVIGGAIGNQVGEEVKENKVEQCLNNQYYVFDRREYAPPAAPKGYAVAYYSQRPYYDTYYTHRNGRVVEWHPRRR
ncbi:glycine zipper 2TM domain-containing protein [Asticcacaulis sp. AND118]|uniref:glycine zipper 2TM domain-containing protein n=1 Tax=Asticcacaulis sp. AND118 TaxID=2840468 RepID=UPI001CFFB41D|nr:glycine zipper 2TM domain-containing protein [Asticcacaulis sp. AND118]UDF04582.1 glycine zipper 2TM domain-containing protein [Asticcacaulis sp. AND118]